MDDEIKDGEELNAKDLNDANEAPADGKGEEHSDYKPVNRFDASAVHHLSGMYQNWFLDYASYVILELSLIHI